MARFGEDLKRERENRGMTLEAMAAETKVKLRHLEEVEQEEYEAMPGGLFRRGIVRAYLTAVGLEEQEWMPRFDRSLEEREQLTGKLSDTTGEAWVAFAENVKRNRAPAAQSRGLRWLGVVGLLLAVLAAAWLVWHFVLSSRIAR